MANDRQSSSNRYCSGKPSISSPISVPSTSHNRFEVESDDDEDDRKENVAVPHQQYHDRIPFRRKKNSSSRPQSMPTSYDRTPSPLRFSEHEADDSQDEIGDRPRRHSLATEIEIGRELQEISDRFLFDFQTTRASPVSQSPASRLRQWWAGSGSSITTTITTTTHHHTSISEESGESS